MQKAMTLLDVARAANVSKTTVSNVFSRPERVRPALRARVEAAARELGYAGPDPKGRMLSSGKVNAIGVVPIGNFGITLFFTHEYNNAFLAGVAQTCEERGVGLSLVSGRQGEWGVNDALVDGFIFETVEQIDLIEPARRRRLPVVVSGVAGPDISSITIENRKGAREVTRHLLELGHRRFVVASVLWEFRRPVFHPPSSTPRRFDAAGPPMVERMAGVADALAEFGLSLDDMPVMEACGTLEEEVAFDINGAAVVLDKVPEATAVSSTAKLPIDAAAPAPSPMKCSMSRIWLNASIATTPISRTIPWYIAAPPVEGRSQVTKMDRGRQSMLSTPSARTTASPPIRLAASRPSSMSISRPIRLGLPISKPCSMTRWWLPAGGGVEAPNHARERGRRRAGRRVLADADPGGEHACMKMMPAHLGLAAIEEGTDQALVEGCLPRSRDGAGASDHGKATDRNERKRNAGREHARLVGSRSRFRLGMRLSAAAIRTGVRRLAGLSSRVARHVEDGVATVPRRPSRRGENGPTFSSRTSTISCLPQFSLAAFRPRSTAVPTVGWPAKGSSLAGVKMRIAALWTGLAGVRTKTVSERLNSRATDCIAATPSPSPSRTTASGFPASGRFAKTSRMA